MTNIIIIDTLEYWNSYISKRELNLDGLKKRNLNFIFYDKLVMDESELKSITSKEGKYYFFFHLETSDSHNFVSKFEAKSNLLKRLLELDKGKKTTTNLIIYPFSAQPELFTTKSNNYSLPVFYLDQLKNEDTYNGLSFYNVNRTGIPKPKLKRKPFKIFISHSSDDELVVNEFSELILQLGIGLNSNNIFFANKNRIETQIGENIKSKIIPEIEKADLFFCFISDNYLASNACICELGASLISHKSTKSISFLLPEFNRQNVPYFKKDTQIKFINDKSYLIDIFQGKFGIANFLKSKGFSNLGSNFQDKIEQFIKRIAKK